MGDGPEDHADAKQRHALSPRALVGHLFRFTSPRYDDFAETSRLSKKYPGRFNTSGLGAVYLSREPDTAAAEALRRYARNATLAGEHSRAAHLDTLVPRSILVVRAQLRDVLALTTPAALNAWGLTAANLSGDDVSPCQEVATLAAQRGAEGVRWPSATGSGESVAIFWENVQAASHIKLVKEIAVRRDWFDALADGAPASRFLPELEDYALYPLDARNSP